MELLLIIVIILGVSTALGKLFRPAPQIVYVQAEHTSQRGMGCMSLITMGLFVILVLMALRL